MQWMIRFGVLSLAWLALCAQSARAQAPVQQYFIQQQSGEPILLTSVAYANPTAAYANPTAAPCATCANGGYGATNGNNNNNGGPILSWIRSFGYLCGSNQCQMGCGSPKTNCTFILGSCRSFFVESCAPCEGNHHGLVPPGIIDCPTCR